MISSGLVWFAMSWGGFEMRDCNTVYGFARELKEQQITFRKKENPRISMSKFLMYVSTYVHIRLRVHMCSEEDHQVASLASCRGLIRPSI